VSTQHYQALLDCNNFFVSCERAFNPKLEKRAVIVLSNNDGCIIARSNEAKALGIPMGAPYFQYKALIQKHQVNILSSNHELYQDLSRRVMTILRSRVKNAEVYSIDEAFFCLNNRHLTSSMRQAKQIRDTILNSTGIPTSIGISTNKTLAKLATLTAKKDKGIFFSKTLLDNSINKGIDIEKIWGIGKQTSQKLRQLGIHTVLELKNTNHHWIRQHFGLQLEKTVLELQGTSCITLNQCMQKKSILSSRSFAEKINDLHKLEHIIAHHCTEVCAKLHRQKSVTKKITVFLQTSKTDKKSVCEKSQTLPHASQALHEIIGISKKVLHEIYQNNLFFSRAGVLLSDISSSEEQQNSLFAPDPLKEEKLTKMVFDIRRRTSSRSLFYAAEGIQQPWRQKQSLRSPRYTTRWNEIPYAN
jgi:DNA polymerase V